MSAVGHGGSEAGRNEDGARGGKKEGAVTFLGCLLGLAGCDLTTELPIH